MRRPVEYVSDEDYNMMRQSDYYSGGYSNGLSRVRGSQLRVVKPAPVMYSSRYRDLRNSESRYEPEIIQRQPVKQMADYSNGIFSSSQHFSNSPQFSSGSAMLYNEPEPKYRPTASPLYKDDPEPNYRALMSMSTSSPLYTEPKYRSNIDDSDFLSSSLRVKSELPDYVRSSNRDFRDYTMRPNSKYESIEDPQDDGGMMFARKHPTPSQSSVENSNWAGSLKFMPRPFGNTGESASNNSPNHRSVPKKTQETSASSNHDKTKNNMKFSYESPASHVKQQPALTIHDLLLQQAKQIQQHDVQSSPAQGRDLSDDYTNINDFMVYNGPHNGDGHKSSAQRYRSNENSGMSRRPSNGGSSSSSESLPQPQYLRYSKPLPDMEDIDAVLDSLPWKVKKR